MSATWQTATFKFDKLDAVTPPLKAGLKVLKAIEAVLEALLDLVKAFLLDFGNPIRSIVALLLAAVRALINQIRSGAINLLLVHPDFARQDFNAVMDSVSGGYGAFEAKVVAKFHDHSDVNRPAYPPGSSAAMVVFYLGAESPGNLLQQLYSLLRLIRHPATVASLPAPVELRVRPVFKSDDASAQVSAAALKVATKFSDNFAAGLDKKLVLEWRMPTTPVASSGPGFANHFASFYNSFRFPSFVVERSDKANGEPVQLRMRTTASSDETLGSKIGKYSMPTPDTMVAVREQNGNVYRHFEHKDTASGARLLEGAFTGTYRYVDDDPNLEHGKAYWYRVRAYFGNPTEYLSVQTAASFAGNQQLVRREGNRYFVNYGKDVVMGLPSPVVRAAVPRLRSGASSDFDVQKDVYEAVQAALLLNFELPPADGGDDPDEVDQKAGWGTLSMAAAQVGALKVAYRDSKSIRGKAMFKFAARRVANTVAGSVYDKPSMMAMLEEQWHDGAGSGGRSVRQIVDTVLNSPLTWGFAPVTGSYGPAQRASVRRYLALEGLYSLVQDGTFTGPYPTRALEYKGDIVNIGPESRQRLAQFLRLCLASRSSATAYMSWYSVGVGDLFPALVPFIFDFEQFLLSLMKALDSIMKEIEAVIQTIIDKIRQLEMFLEAVISLIDALNVDVSVAVLSHSGTNTSAADLATAIVQSGDKPTAYASGLHSGMVLTAGGPGEGAIQAVKALSFILGIKL